MISERDFILRKIINVDYHATENDIFSLKKTYKKVIEMTTDLPLSFNIDSVNVKKSKIDDLEELIVDTFTHLNVQGFRSDLPINNSVDMVVEEIRKLKIN